MAAYTGWTNKNKDNNPSWNGFRRILSSRLWVNCLRHVSLTNHMCNHEQLLKPESCPTWEHFCQPLFYPDWTRTLFKSPYQLPLARKLEQFKIGPLDETCRLLLTPEVLHEETPTHLLPQHQHTAQLQKCISCAQPPSF
jgi:hypothetical protein